MGKGKIQYLVKALVEDPQLEEALLEGFLEEFKLEAVSDLARRPGALDPEDLAAIRHSYRAADVMQGSLLELMQEFVREHLEDDDGEK